MNFAVVNMSLLYCLFINSFVNVFDPMRSVLSSASEALVLLIRCLVSTYTFITLPLYYVIQKPWRVKANYSTLRVGQSLVTFYHKTLRAVKLLIFLGSIY